MVNAIVSKARWAVCHKSVDLHIPVLWFRRQYQQDDKVAIYQRRPNQIHCRATNQHKASALL